MSTRSPARGHLVALVAAVVALAGVLPASGDGEPAACPAETTLAGEPTPRPDCCFTNRAYSGVCVVKPGEGETCASILAYLNNARSAGKAYCGGTNIRGGWQQVSCEAPQSGGPVDTMRR